MNKARVNMSGSQLLESSRLSESASQATLPHSMTVCRSPAQDVRKTNNGQHLRNMKNRNDDVRVTHRRIASHPTRPPWLQDGDRLI